jgi:hypothetical protein
MEAAQFINSLDEINCYEKLNEIHEIYNDRPETDGRDIKYILTSRYKNELTGFKELKSTKRIKEKGKLYIKYINKNTSFGYGGILWKYDKEKLTLINNNMKPFNIIFKDCYVYYQKVLNENEKTRAEFETYLKRLEKEERKEILNT